MDCRKGEGSASASASQVLHLPSLSSQEQACTLLTCAIQHLFLAKGQIPDPIPVLQARRARERLAKSVDGTMMGSRPKSSESFAKRRRTRKIDELLLSIQRLNHSLLSAIQQLRREHLEEGQKDFVLLIRFGQSRFSCRQQILISFQDIVLLAHRDPIAALQDASIRRNKMAMMEKKLVRFLLGLASEDDDFNNLLNSPLGLTRAHIFLLAPSAFICQGWLRQHSLKMADIFFADKNEQQDVMIIEDALIPLPDPIPLQEMRFTSTETDAEAEDIDTKRLKRMQQRAQLQLKKGDDYRRKKQSRGGSLKSAKKQPPSASIILQCGKDGDEETMRLLPKDHCWYACKIVLKGVT